jgi:hypothetical protein
MYVKRSRKRKRGKKNEFKMQMKETEKPGPTNRK